MTSADSQDAKTVDVPALLRTVLETTAQDTDLFHGDASVLPVRLEQGAAESLFVLVTGDNATGKSLFAKVLGANLARKAETAFGRERIAVYNLGMGLRTAHGMARSFVYGGYEGDSSTGAMSLRAVEGGLRQCHPERPRREPCILILDEPDIGLSDAYATALGDLVADETVTLDPQVLAIVVVSHNRLFLNRLKERLTARGSAPHHVACGPGHPGLQGWLDGNCEMPVPSVADLLSIGDRNREGARRVEKILEPRWARYRVEKERRIACATARRDALRACDEPGGAEDKRYWTAGHLLRVAGYRYYPRDGVWRRITPSASGRTAEIAVAAKASVKAATEVLYKEGHQVVIMEYPTVAAAVRAAEDWIVA